jgi:hypothetical protein
MALSFAASHESGYGTFRTQRVARLESVVRSKADICERNTGLLKGSEIEQSPTNGGGESGSVSRPLTRAGGVALTSRISPSGKSAAGR